MNATRVRSFLYQYGQVYKELREQNNLTQLQVANKIKCSQAIISHIEQGYMLPPPKIEVALNKLYKKEF